jgi:hypothetical protein
VSDNKIKNLEDHKILKAVEEQIGLTSENSNIVEALKEAKERSDLIHLLELKKARDLELQGKEPYPCYNSVCENNRSEVDRRNWCAEESQCHGCLFQTLASPPNSLDYDEYMPTHQEALDRLEAKGLLKGDQNDYIENSKYQGKAQSQEARLQQDLAGCSIELAVKAMTEVFRSLRDAGLTLDEDNLIIFQQNFSVELEKTLGIYPNIDLRRI